MGRTSATVKNRYATKAYDRLAIIVPKGRKETVEAFAASHGESVNGLVNRLLQEAVGLTAADWKGKQEEAE